MERRGIILLGGTGSRLRPNSISVSKGLMSIFSKPLCYYPLSVLFLAGIKKILIISTEYDLPAYKKLLGDGSEFGLEELSYAVQSFPNGISEAFIIGERFLKGSSSCLCLGDNLFYGNNLINLLKNANNNENASIFTYRVKNPEVFGVVEVDKDNQALSIEEKPKFPKSDLCITGIYFLDEKASEYSKSLKPSPRNELEITSLLDIYLKQNKLNVEIMGRGYYWSDLGQVDSILDASNFIAAIEKRQNIHICNPHEIAFNNKWIGTKELEATIDKFGKNNYSDYLRSLIE